MTTTAQAKRLQRARTAFSGARAAIDACGPEWRLFRAARASMYESA